MNMMIKINNQDPRNNPNYEYIKNNSVTLNPENFEKINPKINPNDNIKNKLKKLNNSKKGKKNK